MKFNWGTGIALALAAFIIFILSFVYRVMFNDEYNHHLVSDEYYKEELHYQEQIDKMNNANNLEENLKILQTEKGLEVVFPKEFDTNKIQGTIYLQRLSKKELDINVPIELMSNVLIIPKEKLLEGRYDVKIDWTYNGKGYLFKKKIRY
ncbi:FixH family protein [Aureivirga marina]|uniref:FixH family protein n=1 Tax=Aureivirga marina TaxID=1182451 RepID=UPI0018CA2E39|nr:FixH family protein [Aureivirga marina]